jgi:hypothetical protein
MEKNESIRCACGKTDLYEEWLKLNEKEKDETTVSPSNEHESVNNPVNSDGNKK